MRKIGAKYKGNFGNFKTRPKNEHVNTFTCKLAEYHILCCERNSDAMKRENEVKAKVEAVLHVFAEWMCFHECDIFHLACTTLALKFFRKLSHGPTANHFYCENSNSLHPQELCLTVCTFCLLLLFYLILSSSLSLSVDMYIHIYFSSDL